MIFPPPMTNRTPYTLSPSKGLQVMPFSGRKQPTMFRGIAHMPLFVPDRADVALGIAHEPPFVQDHADVPLGFFHSPGSVRDQADVALSSVRVTRPAGSFFTSLRRAPHRPDLRGCRALGLAAPARPPCSLPRMLGRVAERSREGVAGPRPARVT